MKRKRLKRGRIGRTEKLRVPAGGTKAATGLVQDLEVPPRGSYAPASPRVNNS